MRLGGIAVAAGVEIFNSGARNPGDRQAVEASEWGQAAGMPMKMRLRGAEK
jgi:hypothetical protein